MYFLDIVYFFFLETAVKSSGQKIPSRDETINIYFE